MSAMTLKESCDKIKNRCPNFGEWQCLLFAVRAKGLTTTEKQIESFFNKLIEKQTTKKDNQVLLRQVFTSYRNTNRLDI